MNAGVDTKEALRRILRKGHETKDFDYKGPMDWDIRLEVSRCHRSASVREVCKQCSGLLVQGDSTMVYAGCRPGMKCLKELTELVRVKNWSWHN